MIHYLFSVTMKKIKSTLTLHFRKKGFKMERYTHSKLQKLKSKQVIKKKKPSNQVS